MILFALYLFYSSSSTTGPPPLFTDTHALNCCCAWESSLLVQEANSRGWSRTHVANFTQRTVLWCCVSGGAPARRCTLHRHSPLGIPTGCTPWREERKSSPFPFAWKNCTSPDGRGLGLANWEAEGLSFRKKRDPHPPPNTSPPTHYCPQTIPSILGACCH